MSGEGACVGLDRCWVCGNLFAFDCDRVPSVLIDPVTETAPDLLPDDQQAAAFSRATKRPLCPACVEVVNVIRAADGLSLYTEGPL